MKFHVNTPSVSHMLDELLAYITLKELAKYCGRAPSTIERYRRTNDAPQSVCMALHWITANGRLHMHHDLAYEATTLRGLSNSLEGQCQQLKREIAALEAENARLQSTRPFDWLTASNAAVFTPGAEVSTRRSPPAVVRKRSMPLASPRFPFFV